jgi:hypothetical protein
MDYGWNYPFKDFTGVLSKIGSDIGGGLRQREINSALSDFNGDYNAAANKLMQMGMVDEAVKLYGASALGDYRTGQLGVATERAYDPQKELMRQYLKANPNLFGAPAAEGSRLGPSDLSGKPAFIQKEFMSLEGQAKANESGKAAAELESMQTRKERLGGNVEGSLRDILTQVQGMDDASVENALGPFQGQTALPGASRSEEGRNFVSQQIGAILNATPWGGKENTSEVRNIVRGGQAAIAAAIKPLVRGPGEGVFSDKDQALLDNIVGDLTTVKDKAEFYRRLKGVQSRVKNSLGIDVSLPELDAVFQQGAAGKAVQDRLPQEAPMDMATDPPVQGNMGGPTRDKYGAPQVRPEHKQQLIDALAKHPDPRDQQELMDEWERTYPDYGRGAADHALGRDYQAGR